MTEVATELQNDGLISYRRGKVKILDIDMVERRACECHQVVRDLYVEEFGNTESSKLPPEAGQAPQL